MNKELNLCEDNNLFRCPYRKKYILKNINSILKSIKWWYQRMRYGISRYDAWDLDSYILIVLENGLKFLKDAGNSYPGWCTYEEWQNKLAYMIKLSELANRHEDEVTKQSFDKYLEIEKKFGLDSEECIKAKNEWLKDEENFEITKMNSRDRLIKELRKYIADLWD